MKLRPYQTGAIEAIRKQLAIHPSTLAVLATGLGKTVVFAFVAGEWPANDRVLVLAHRDELITQAAGKLECAVGAHDVGIEKGFTQVDENVFSTPRVVVSSVQTMCRPKRQQKFKPKDFGLIITDEAHHATAASYRSIYEYFLSGNPGIKHLGVTATPTRADEAALGQVYASVAVDYGIEQAIEDGWLVPVRQRACKVDGLDFSRVKVFAGDFSEGELDRILSEEKTLHATAGPIVRTVGNTHAPTLVFCASVNHAHLMAAVIDRYTGVAGSAIALDGTTDIEERRKAVANFKAGRVQYLCNCGLFLEGFDAPNTAVVAMVRPTKSLALYTQCLGRGTRPLEGIVDRWPEDWQLHERKASIANSAKPYMTVLDFVGNSGAHKIITAADVLGGKYPDSVRQRAGRLLADERQAGEGDDDAVDASDSMSTGELLERASVIDAFLAEVAERRRQRVTADVAYSLTDVSPFDSEQALSKPKGKTSAGGGRRGESATPRQVGYLVGVLGWTRDAAMHLAKHQASAVIGKSMASK